MRKNRRIGQPFQPSFLQVLFAIVTFLISSLFYVWARYESTHLTFDLSKISSQQKNLLDAKRSLTIEINNLSSLDRVEKIARKKFGLKEPSTKQIIYLTAKEK